MQDPHPESPTGAPPVDTAPSEALPPEATPAFNPEEAMNNILLGIQGLAAKLGEFVDITLPMFKQMLTNEVVLFQNMGLLMDKRFNEERMQSHLQVIANCTQAVQILQKAAEKKHE